MLHHPPSLKPSKQLLDTFTKIKDRLRESLQQWPLKLLEGSYEDIIGSIRKESQTEKDDHIRSFLESFLSQIPAATNPTEYISAFEFLLTEYYHKSLDNRIPTSTRRYLLSCFQNLLIVFDSIQKNVEIQPNLPLESSLHQTSSSELSVSENPAGSSDISLVRNDFQSPTPCPKNNSLTSSTPESSIIVTESCDQPSQTDTQLTLGETASTSSTTTTTVVNIENQSSSLEKESVSEENRSPLSATATEIDPTSQTHPISSTTSTNIDQSPQSSDPADSSTSSIDSQKLDRSESQSTHQPLNETNSAPYSRDIGDTISEGDSPLSNTEPKSQTPFQTQTDPNISLANTLTRAEELAYNEERSSLLETHSLASSTESITEQRIHTHTGPNLATITATSDSQLAPTGLSSSLLESTSLSFSVDTDTVQFHETQSHTSILPSNTVTNTNGPVQTHILPSALPSTTSQFMNPDLRSDLHSRSQNIPPIAVVRVDQPFQEDFESSRLGTGSPSFDANPIDDRHSPTDAINWSHVPSKRSDQWIPSDLTSSVFATAPQSVTAHPRSNLHSPSDPSVAFSITGTSSNHPCPTNLTSSPQSRENYQDHFISRGSAKSLLVPTISPISSRKAGNRTDRLANLSNCPTVAESAVASHHFVDKSLISSRNNQNMGSSSSKSSQSSSDNCEIIEIPDSDDENECLNPSNIDPIGDTSQPRRSRRQMQHEPKLHLQGDSQLLKQDSVPKVYPSRTPVVTPICFWQESPSPNFSSSLDGRSSCDVLINTGLDCVRGDTDTPSTTLEGTDLYSFHQRLELWDPNWRVIQDISTFKDRGFDFGYKTCRIFRCELEHGEPPKSACRIMFSISQLLKGLQDNQQVNIRWGESHSGSYNNGERRLLLRMLPLQIPEEYKKTKADTHLWPKGTFIQFNGRPVPIVQRKQQSHNPIEWKGLSRVLDLTSRCDVLTEVQELKLCTRDEYTYGVQLALCEYVSPEKLMDILLNPKSQISPGSIKKQSYEEGLDFAIKRIDDALVTVIDSDNEESVDHSKPHGAQSVTFSLLCPMSRTPLVIPVRGVDCKHIQCFDLSNFLGTNKSVSGGRWRCGVCEEFVSVQNLVLDQFCAVILEHVKNSLSGSRHRIELKRNGSWLLLGEDRIRHKRNNDDDERYDDEENMNKRLKTHHVETIDLL